MAGGSIPSNLAPIFQAAGRAFNIPPAVLAGISSVESNLFRNMGPSSTGAVGGMQFEPGTARSLGINPMDPRQAIFGAAKLLVQYGYHQNPTRAIGAYNGGPGNPQYGYARQVLSEAQRLGGELGGAGSTTAVHGVPGLNQAIPSTTQTFNQAGFQKAQDRYIAGQALKQLDSGGVGVPGTSSGFDQSLGGGSDPLFSSGLLPTKAPNPQDYIHAQTSLQTLAGPTVLRAHPVVAATSGQVSDIAGGFLPKGAKYIQGRKDQGRDGQTNPGSPIVADGNGVVVNVLSDPNGFGPRYPVVHFTSGHYAGRTLYFGHTLAAVRPGEHVHTGQPISYTGRGPGGVGNATVPGWFEIGYADSGSPGPLGQSAPF